MFSSPRLLVALILTVTARLGALLFSKEGYVSTVRNTLYPTNHGSLEVLDSVTIVADNETNGMDSVTSTMDNGTSMMDFSTSMMKEDMRDFHVCHATPSLQYFCEGPKYDQFATNFEALVINITQHENVTHGLATPLRSACWGKRQFPFPPNKKILVVGNSHTRQIFLSLACQYQTLQFMRPEFPEASEINATVMPRGTYYFMEFLNHAKLHLVANHALFYSRKWRQYLESTIKTKLEHFDHLIVGKMNVFKDSYNTSFMSAMMEKTKEFEEADFTTVSPPTIYDFARVFRGPIVAHSMMADYGGDVLNREMTRLVQRVNRKNVQFVNGRTYIPLLGECSSDQWDKAMDCMSRPKGHRCIGRRGGHPDLIAWDIIEAVNGYKNSCQSP